MATASPTASTGPFLQLACLCEKVLHEKDGVLSLIRIIDRITQTATGIDVPDRMPPFITDLKLVLSLKAGQARGRYAIKVRPEDPSGTQLPAHEMPIQLSPGNQGVNLISDFRFPVQYEGVYWFDIFFVPGGGAEDWLLTRVPLQLLYQPQRLSPAPG